MAAAAIVETYLYEVEAANWRSMIGCRGSDTTRDTGPMGQVSLPLHPATPETWLSGDRKSRPTNGLTKRSR